MGRPKKVSEEEQGYRGLRSLILEQYKPDEEITRFPASLGGYSGQPKLGGVSYTFLVDYQHLDDAAILQQMSGLEFIIVIKRSPRAGLSLLELAKRDELGLDD